MNKFLQIGLSLPLQSKRGELWKTIFTAGRCSSSTFSRSTKKEAVVLSDNGNVIVCWHPEAPMPYELTKPIPVAEKRTSKLKSAHDQMHDIFYRKHPYFEHKKLMELTFTDKKLWYRKRAEKFVKFKEQMPKDREYL